MYFDSNKKHQSIDQIEQAKGTKLTSFLEHNCQDKSAQTLLYRQLPEHIHMEYQTKEVEEIKESSK